MLKWTREKVEEESKKYTTRSSFRAGSKGAYERARKCGWLKEFYWLVPAIRKGVNEVWTKSKVINEAKKYQSKFAFQKGSKFAYNKALKNGWLKEFYWFKTPMPQKYDKQRRDNCIYAYFSKDNKHVYVGRTVNINQRHCQHNRIQKGKYDSVKSWFVEHNEKLPKPILLMEGLTIASSQYWEDFFAKKYLSSGYCLINKGRTGLSVGSIGRLASKYTYEECKKYALECGSRKAFREKYYRYYVKARAKKWLSDWLKPETRYKYSLEECLDKAKKYKTLSEFRQGDLKLYQYCRKRGFLDNMPLIGKMRKRSPKVIGIKKEDVISLSKHFKYSSDFKRAYPSHYQKARVCGWLKDLHFEKYVKYSYEYWINIAKQFKTKQEFRKKCPSLMHIGYSHGWINDSIWEGGQRHLTDEYCLNVAKSYTTIGSLRQSDKGVYAYLLKNKALKMAGLKYRNNQNVPKMIEVYFYKGDLNFPITGADWFSTENKKSIRRIINSLKPYLGKTENIRIDKQSKRKILLSNFVKFCESEGLNPNGILQIQVSQDDNIFKIIVNEGKNDNVKLFTIK